MPIPGSYSDYIINPTLAALRRGAESDGPKRIIVRVSADVRNRTITIDLGSPVTAFEVTADRAESLIDRLQTALWELRGIK